MSRLLSFLIILIVPVFFFSSKSIAYSIIEVSPNSSFLDPDPFDNLDFGYDWYSVEIKTAGKIKVWNDKADGCLGLYSQSFSLLKKEYGTPKGFQPISLILNPGKYYISCCDSSLYSRYTLSVSFTKDYQKVLPHLFLLMQ